MKSRLLMFCAALVLAVFSCEQKESAPEFWSGLYPEHMDSTVRPGDNFFAYINGGWIKNTEIPADKSSYGIGYILHEKSQDDVKAIIEESSEGDFAFGTDEQKVGDLYASYMNMEKRNELGITPLNEDFAMIDGIQNLTDLSRVFATIGKYGGGTPLNFFVGADWKTPTEYSLFCWQGGLGLPDREYYLSDEGNFPANREAYMDHMVKMFELAGFDGSAQMAKEMMDLESQIAAVHWKKEENRDRIRMYNPFPVDSLDAVISNFDWKVFLEESETPNLDKIIITQPSFVMGLNDILASTDISVWKKYCKWLVLNDGASRISEDFDNQNFEFYSKTLRGTQEQRPMWRRGVSVVNGNLGEVVGKVYVKRHFPAEAKERMTKLVENLTKAYEMSIKDLDWMSDSTKEQALVKLSKFTTKIGYPDKWKDYSEVVINPEDLTGNIKSANLAVHRRELAKLGGPIDKTEWHMNPQTVNAYYNPPMNEIVFPAAIMQAPIFDLTADDAVNYGGIGAIIGHEIGHGFDDKGSTYDGDGALNNWWTDEDRSEFEKRTQKLVAQYDSYELFDDLNVNGTFTLGENIGDLGGMSIALKAYQLSLNGQEAPEMDGLSGTQRFFLGYTQTWRNKSREETTRMRVRTDPHSPPKFRVNGVVRNVPEWYEAFNIQEGDSLYLPPEERVKIW